MRNTDAHNDKPDSRSRLQALEVKEYGHPQRQEGAYRQARRTNAELREQLTLHLTVEAPGLLHKNIRKLEDELKARWENTEQAEDEITKLPDLKREVEDRRRDFDSKSLRIGGLEASNHELDVLVGDADSVPNSLRPNLKTVPFFLNLLYKN